MGNSCIKTNKINPIVLNNKLINWEATHKTEKYHWWPMHEQNENDIVNNLYADGNALSKYDELFDTDAVKYQKEHYYISKLSEREDKCWAGFCNYSAILSSLYKYPKHSVFIKHNDIVKEFTTWDIQQLMIIACNNAIKSNISFFFGIRNNTNTEESKEEPLPSELFDMLDIICKNDMPFIMDIDHRTQVWNYAYDKVEVYKHDICPLPHEIPKLGKTEYYNFKITSNAYPDQNQNLWGYVNTKYDKSGYISDKKEKWLSESHPDFIWAKYPINTPWEGKCKINPNVNAHIVYEIYKKSLSKHSNTIIFNKYTSLKT